MNGAQSLLERIKRHLRATHQETARVGRLPAPRGRSAQQAAEQRLQALRIDHYQLRLEVIRLRSNPATRLSASLPAWWLTRASGALDFLQRMVKAATSGTSEADPMAWVPKPNRTKLLDDVRRSQAMARKLDARMRAPMAARRAPRIEALPANLQASLAQAGNDYLQQTMKKLAFTSTRSSDPVLRQVLATALPQIKAALRGRIKQAYARLQTALPEQALGDIRSPDDLIISIFRTVAHNMGVPQKDTDAAATSLRRHCRRPRPPATNCCWPLLR